MLLFRALTLTVLGNQGIGPFPDEVRTLSNGFTEGYLGNVGLGPLGGADLFTLLVGLVAVGRHRRRPSGAPAPARLRLRPDRRPAAACSSLKIVGAGRRRDVRRRAAGPVQEPAVGAGAARRRWSLGYTLLTNRAVFGRHIYAVGGNLQAATLSGVKVKSVTFWIFVNMGVLAAIAGIIFAGRLNQAGPTAGNAFELDAIAAAFIGGAAVQGGVGKVVGAITGGLIMGVINNGMSLIGAPSERVMLVKGLVLLAAVAFDVWTKRRAGALR